MTAPTQPAPTTSPTMTAAKIAAIVALAQAQAKVRQQITEAAVAAAIAPFKAFTGWWSADDVNRAIDQVLRVVQPMQRQMARTTDAYLARVASEMTGRTVRPVGTVDVTRIRRRITEEVAAELVDGRREPAFLVLGEFDPATGEVSDDDDIDTPISLAIPEPTRAAARPAATARLQAEQLRAIARRQAAALAAATRATQRQVTPTTPARTPTTPTAASTRTPTAVPTARTPAAETAAQRRTAAAEQLAAQLRRLAAQRRAAASRTAASTPARTPARSAPVTRTVDADDVVDPATPYGRVADQYRYQVVAEGIDEDTARERALDRLEAVARTDVTLAVREQVRATLGAVRGVTGYRRIVRPELSESGPCGLCIVAANRVYRVEDLHPIHDRCVCDVLPIIGNADPGLFLNRRDLRLLYEAAGSTSGFSRGRNRTGRGLKAIRVALAEHGELGPVLVNADHRYRGPAQVARTTHADPDVRARARLEAFEERLDVLLARQGRGEAGLDAAVEWQTERVQRLRRELGGAAPYTPPRRAAPVRRTRSRT